MKKLTFAILAFLSMTLAQAQTTYDPTPNPDAVVESGNVRFTVLTPEMVRIQYSSSKIFEERATFGVVNRNLPVPEFTVNNDGKYLYIKTSALELRYKIGGHIRPSMKSPSTLQITMQMDGHDVVWYPGKEDALNLKGTMRTLDNTSGATKRDQLEDGVISRSGWAVIDESHSTTRGDGSQSFPLELNEDGFEWFSQPADANALDLYFLGYGHDYKKALLDFTKVSGKIPLPPKYMFGYWYSRFWAYSQDDYINLVNEIEENDIPIDVMIMDMDWHLSGWTGWTWNTSLIPSPRYLINFMHHHNLKVALNLHPADGIANYDDHYEEIRDDLGYDSSYTDRIPWKIDDYSYYKSIFNRIIRDRESEGVDFWWIDWQQWLISPYTDGLGETIWNNHVFWNDMVKNRPTRRPAIYHRWGGLGNHRYQIGFSGDTYCDWATLKYQPSFTSNASNVGYGYWGHDLGGHQQDRDNDPERYLRWMQFGALSPIFRTHAVNDASVERRIWKYPNFKQLRETVLLRYALFPYIYTAAREAYDTGICICRPLYYDSPEESKAYEFEDEYMFGGNILVAPITSPSDDDGTTLRTTWLPEGKWWDVAKGRLVNGNITFSDRYAQDEIPYFYKAGAVIVNYPKQNTVQVTPDSIILKCAPGGSGTGSFYEDEGDNADYDSNYAMTKYAFTGGENSATLTIGGRTGSFDGMPTTRTYVVEMIGAEGSPTSVTVNGTAVSDDAYDYDADSKVITVNIPMDDMTETKTLTVAAPFCETTVVRDEYNISTGTVETNPTMWITGSAVPGGTQPLEVHPNGQMKFHGSLQPGELYIIDTDGIREGTTFYAPRYTYSNIVNSGIAYNTKTTQTGSAWSVDCAADNYRFTVNTTSRNVKGELFIWPLEMYIGGGCVADEQQDQWYTAKFELMDNLTTDRNVWTWVGELKNRTGNVESNRLKLMAQKDWGPTSFHPYTADEDLLTANQMATNGDDTKWTIAKDGYYRIVVDVFRETIKAEYLGTEIPAGIAKTEVEDSNNSRAYNTAGQAVDEKQRGIVIKGNRKVINN